MSVYAMSPQAVTDVWVHGSPVVRAQKLATLDQEALMERVRAHPRLGPRMSDVLETIEIETGPSPRAAIIWMHGLGADGHDFEPIVPELGMPAAPAVRFVFPHAPVQPVTINGGVRMRAWYDVTGDGRQDATGIRASHARVEGLLARGAPAASRPAASSSPASLRAAPSRSTPVSVTPSASRASSPCPRISRSPTP
jgi:Predicted esterase